ncbi:hypothetical protein OROGR_027710 [Orobanche gracilis]
MPPKMADRVDALEERMATMEVSVQQSLVEFRQSILEEFAKLRNTRQEDETPTSPFLEDLQQSTKWRLRKWICHRSTVRIRLGGSPVLRHTSKYRERLRK